MNDAERDQVKQTFREEHGIEVSDEDIDHAVQAANEATQRKRVQLELLPLRRHLWFHHHASGTTYLGLKELEAVHETAPRQGSHPEGEL